MGWYGGQEGAARQRWRDQSRAALGRFRASVRGGAALTDLYASVADNHNKSVTQSSMLVCNPMSQEDIVRAINEAAPDASADGGWAVTIAASENLKDLSLLNDVAGQITGLFLYGLHHLEQAQKEELFSKLTNLESLTLVNCSPLNVFREDGLFLKSVFAAGMLPKLKFLETDAATDDVIAEMGTCPDLTTLVFDYPTNQITNEGIQQLVDNGGGKELMNVACGTLNKHLSKTLTKKYVAATLPKLVNLPQHQAFQHLSHMAVGAKKKSKVERLQAKHAAEDSKPFAVVPPERMTYEQLTTALQRRGVAHKIPKKRTEEVRQMFTSGQVGWTHDQELGFQNRAKLEHLQGELEKLRQSARRADGTVAALETLPPSKAGKLYPLWGAFEIEGALRAANVRIPREASKRRDERARLLHDSGYQGGGDVAAQIAHYRKVGAGRREKVAEKEEEIQLLRREMALKDTTRGANASAGSKRSFEVVLS